MTHVAAVVMAVAICLPGALAQQEPTAAENEPAIAEEEPATVDPLRMVLPADVYAVVGHEMSIYFDNVVLTRNLSRFVFDVDCAKGRQDEDRWRYVATVDDVGEYALSIKVCDETMAILAQAQTTLHVVAADTGWARQFTLLCVGDSLTHASYYPEELWRLFDTEGYTKVQFIGTHHPRESLPPEVVHEGYGGWAWQTFCTKWDEGDDVRAKSKFLRLVDGEPTLDFQNYCDINNGGQGPDFITVLLGCNDTFSANEQTIEQRIDTMFGYADTLLAQFKAVRPDTQIGILLLVPPAATQDAFGTNYACSQTRWQYRRNQHRVVERQLEKFLPQQEQFLCQEQLLLLKWEQT